MSNTISQPNTINLARTSGVDTWQFPVTAEIEPDLTNPAAIARAEYNQHQYAESLARDDGVETTGVYADNTGNAIDPANAEAVLNAAAEVVDAYEATPEMTTEPAYTPEQHHAAVNQSQIYARRIVLMRQGAAANWGAESPN